MIDAAKLALAEQLFNLKQGSRPLYEAIGKALMDVSDPEMKGLLSAPRDQLEGQQGRARMITEMLEVYFRCEEMVNHPRSAPAPRRQAGPSIEGLLNGR